MGVGIKAWERGVGVYPNADEGQKGVGNSSRFRLRVGRE